jgi:hypothetical protein
MIFVKNNKATPTKRGDENDRIEAIEEAAVAGQQGGDVFHARKNN